jgi:hypothetical protein
MKFSQTSLVSKPQKSLIGEMSSDFIDYCNEKNYSLVEWYQWRLHIIKERKKLENESNRTDPGED